MPKLYSKVGCVSFRRRTLVQQERGSYYDLKLYEFNFDNGMKCDVPEDVWEDLREQYLDRSTNLKYKEAFLTI